MYSYYKLFLSYYIQRFENTSKKNQKNQKNQEAKRPTETEKRYSYIPLYKNIKILKASSDDKAVRKARKQQHTYHCFLKILSKTMKKYIAAQRQSNCLKHQNTLLTYIDTNWIYTLWKHNLMYF